MASPWQLDRRRALGDDVEVVLNAYDETNTVIPVKRIIRRLRGDQRLWYVWSDVQSNQFPRAMDLARR